MIEADRYAVFGQPIKHSKSPSIHRLFAEQTGQRMTYSAQEVGAADFGRCASAFFEGGGKGLNCTVPLKELAYAFADRLTPRAQSAKAVNTLLIAPDGVILGDNTDGCGLVRDLTVNHHVALTGIDVLILGAGGAARGIIGPLLEQRPAGLTVANRTEGKALALADEFTASGPVQGCGFDGLSGRQFDLILNATSASLSGELPPLPESLLAASGCCYDLAYGNEPTPFVRWGIDHGAQKSLDGLGMLVEQAAEAFYLWRGILPKTRPVIDLLDSDRI